MGTQRQTRWTFLSRALVLTFGLMFSSTVWADESVDQNAANRNGANQQARQILGVTGVRGGLVVHLGARDGKLTAALHRSDSYLVQGLSVDSTAVEAARREVKRQGLYGKVSIDQLRGRRLPYTDNLVNLIVAESTGDISMDEIVRVLVPHGVAYIKHDGRWKKTVKPRPANIDEWTHFMHDAGGNAVAHDDVVAPPRHLQWIGSPRWSRHHDRMASTSAMVSTGGRIFYVMDEGSRTSIQLPAHWKLIARDAFNGTILWKRTIPNWHNHLWPLKSGPTQLARRLVAIGDRVYVTLGFAAPLSVLDAATGKTIRTYQETGATEEVIVSDDHVFALVNRGAMRLREYAPGLNVGDQNRVAREFRWNRNPREVVAIEAATGKLLWSRKSIVAPITLAADRKRVFFHDDKKIVCLDRQSGQAVWNSQPVSRRAVVTFNFGPKLVVVDDVVLYAGGDRKMKALAVDTGKQLWTAPHAHSAYASPEDLLVAGGLVWVAPTTNGSDSGVFTGRDLHTGEVKSQFAPNVKTYWFHHRCYMAKATDRFLLPSRTGIEFVDYKKQTWNINHWVRGGCLYGIMPCNGLVYTPPHNCACYLEAKLYGLNALAPASASRQVTREVDDKNRLVHGPAQGQIENPQSFPQHPTDWPVYRHDSARSGFTPAKISARLVPEWQTKLGGRLSSVVIAAGKLFVAQVDQHTVHALDAESGKPAWSYTVGGRVDSPPAYHEGTVLFGSADGYVYCLRASDGELVWRFRAAPRDEQLMSFEQLESVWPVHGTVLVQDGFAYFAVGRSVFLDGGLRFLKLNARTGEKLNEQILDNRDPRTGKNLQSHVQMLNMPVGLTDILSSDGESLYMRSQQFDAEGYRQRIAPHSPDPATQGSVQRGEGVHLFSANGFIDGSYFHRAYWVYGRSYAGGHTGYYQAGKYAPSGRLLVFDEQNVYGFGRKGKYYRWTTIMEHQLFSASKEAPDVPRVDRRGRVTGGNGSVVRVAKSKSLDPTGTPLAVEAWVKAAKPDGVVVARGGLAQGFALVLRRGRPQFNVRVSGTLSTVTAKESVVGKWTHLIGVLTPDKKLQLYVNGALATSSKASGLIASDPVQAMQIGGDEGSAVGDYNSPLTLTGLIDEVRVYHGPFTVADAKSRFEKPDVALAKEARLVLAYSFAGGQAKDASGSNNHGTVAGAKAAKGQTGGALAFIGRATNANRGGGSFVKHHWACDVPLIVRAMAGASGKLFIAGPPDVIDEEQTFAKLTKRDKTVDAALAKQDAALNGAQGAKLMAIDAHSGKTLGQVHLDSLPVWDGMAITNGRLYLTTTDGKVRCLRGE